MSIKIGLNGFGRIARSFLRKLIESETQIEIKVINDLMDSATAGHLFKYDSTRGSSPAKIHATAEHLYINAQKIRIFQEAEARIPWADFGVDLVIESTGREEFGARHLKNGAQKVIMSTAAQGVDFTCILGINENQYQATKHHLISNASCTSNCLGIILKVLGEHYGISQCFMTSIHPYTNSQVLLDKAHRDLRRARTAGQSIIPTETEAIKAIEQVIPGMRGKIHGLTIRVPTVCVALLNIIITLKKPSSTEEIYTILKQSSRGPLSKILEYNENPLVSSDYKNNTHSAIIDGLSTQGKGQSFQILAWYDNEWGYTSRLLELTEHIMRQHA